MLILRKPLFQWNMPMLHCRSIAITSRAEGQQREAAGFGMWLFLLTEIMFFGGLFFAYLLYRNWYNPAFVAASHQLSIPLGGINTAILISSGFFMAMGVWAAEIRTAACWCCFSS